MKDTVGRHWNKWEIIQYKNLNKLCLFYRYFNGAAQIDPKYESSAIEWFAEFWESQGPVLLISFV